MASRTNVRPNETPSQPTEGRVPRKRNVFAGEKGLEQFLDPARTLTPLVELPRWLNPYRKDKVRIFLKLNYLTPLLNGKSLGAYNLLRAAWYGRVLDGIRTVVVNSSGSMAFCLAIFARIVFGINDLEAVVKRGMSPSKLLLLRLVKCKPLFAAEEEGIEVAKGRGNDEKVFNAAQYEDENNTHGSGIVLDQLWYQTWGEMTHYVASMGTCGTANAAHVYAPSVVSIGVRPTQDRVSGTRPKNRLEGVVPLYDPNRVDHIEDITIDDDNPQVLDLGLKLISSGLLVGLSGALALAGAFQHVEKMLRYHPDSLPRNSRGEVLMCVVCMDTALHNLEAYGARLDQLERT